MAKQQQKQKIDISNSKTFWVILLCGISFAFAFPQLGSFFQQGEATVATVDGRDLTRSDLQALNKSLDLAGMLDGGLFYGKILSELRGNRTDNWALQYYAYLNAAHELGIRTSRKEVGEKRRAMWRGVMAAEKARSELPGELKPNDWQARFTLQQRIVELQKQYEDEKRFDKNGWHQIIRNQRLNPQTFEAMLGDILTLAKLDEYLKGQNAVVSEQDVYDRYVELRQKRSPSWVPVKPSADLEKKIRESITDDELTGYLAANGEEFQRDASLSCEYLFIPKEKVKENVAKAVADEDLQKHYDQFKGRYVRPNIRADGAEFALLSAADMEKRSSDTYQPLAEVKDRVREEVVDEKTQQELFKVRREIRDMVFPRDAAAPRQSFEDVQKKYDYVVIGRVEPTTSADADKGFGAAMSRTVTSWFKNVDTAGDLKETQRDALTKQLFYATDDRGYIAYRSVVAHEPSTPELAEIRKDVEDSVYRGKLLDALVAALDAKVEESKKGGIDLATLKGTEVEVKVKDGVTAKATLGDVTKSLGPVGKPSSDARYDGQREQIFVTQAIADAQGTPKEEAEDAKDGDDEKDEDDPDEYVVHESSRSIAEALFAIEKAGQAGVARDDATGFAFLVRCDDVVSPDKEKFATRRSSIRRELEDEKYSAFLTAWLEKVHKAAGIETVEVEDPAASALGV